MVAQNELYADKSQAIIDFGRIVAIDVGTWRSGRFRRCWNPFVIQIRARPRWHRFIWHAREARSEVLNTIYGSSPGAQFAGPSSTSERTELDLHGEAAQTSLALVRVDVSLP
jgi:hypothetical protein